MINHPREQGMKAFKDGIRFDHGPYQGFTEAQIELRWEWQKGWLRSQLDQQDYEQKIKETK